MIDYSNVTAVKRDFLIQRGSSKGWVFMLNYANGIPVDWRDFPGVQMDWRAGNKVVLEHKIGTTFVIDPENPTRLQWYPWGVGATEDLGKYEYEYDFKLPVPTIGALYLLRGIVKVVDNITK